MPIRLPSGRNGFHPELSLGYSTGHGNGPFGLGWRLSVPTISRKTSRGVPTYEAEEDVFVLSGAEDLVPVRREAASTRYRPRTEGLFARILRHRSSEGDFWEVRSKDGLRSVYGAPPASGGEPTVVADPTDRDRIFAWKLTRTEDAFGNQIVYRYLRDRVPGGSGSEAAGERSWEQLYLQEIRYVDFESATGDTRYLVSVAFDYEDRPDPFSEHRSGFEIRTRKRCRRIRIRTHADEERLTRTYELSYLDDAVEEGSRPPSSLPQNAVSLLSAVEDVGHDGDRSEALPPLEFGYTRFRPEEADLVPFGGQLPSRSLANPNLDLVDLSGDGLPDVVEIDGSVRYWSNRGDGRFDLPRDMADAPAGIRLADPGVQLLDADGDARIDLMVSYGNGSSGYFTLRHDGEWDRRSFRRYERAPSVDLEDPTVRLVDVDGDGVTDALRSGTRLELFFNDPDEGWGETRRVSRRPSQHFPDVDFSDPRVRLADMSGDGLQDVVLVYDGNVEYWPALGRGEWGPRIHMEDSPRFPEGYDPRRILVGDVDGDGAADLVYVDHCSVTLWVNQTGNGWSDAVEIDGTPPVADPDELRLVDALGTGVRGVLWSRDRRGDGRPNLHFLDFTARVKPHLLSHIDNHLGAVTRVAYEPSTAFYLADREDGRTWRTTLPFPVQVVSRVEVVDEISGGKLTTEYRYHDGHWDGAEREFRGFGMVEQLDSEVFADYDRPGLHPEEVGFDRVDEERFSPPTLTRTWFHQGPVGPEHGGWKELDRSEDHWSSDPDRLGHVDGVDEFLRGLGDRRMRRDALRSLRGRTLRTEVYGLDGSEREDRPYTVTELRYDLREVDPPDAGDPDRVRVFFPHTVAQRTTQWERGEDPMTRLSFTGDYDVYGRPRSQVDIAVPRGRDFSASASSGEPYLATHTVTDLAQRDTADVYIVDRVARTTTREILNDGSPSAFELAERIENGSASARIVGQTLNFYDGRAFTGLPFGQVGEAGALKRTESLVLTDEILAEAYPGEGPTMTGSNPPYFAHTGAPAWPAEYPRAYAAAHPTDPHADATRPGLAVTPLGYGFARPAQDTAFEAGGYYVAQERLDHDGRGRVVARREPRGRDTPDRDVTIEYDRFGLLPEKVTDAVGLETRAEHDYRVLRPSRVVDSNGNAREFDFTPQGHPEAVFVRGERGEGDAAHASTRFEYDFRAFADSPVDDRQPVFVRTIRREHHDGDVDVPSAERDATIETIEFSDGYGRRVQTRTQAEDMIWGDDPVFGNGVLPLDPSDEPATNESVRGQRRGGSDPAVEPPNVVVSGWTTYDNKGRAVEQFEPFYAQGWDFLSRREAMALRDGGGADLFGRKVRQFYDPRGQVVRTVRPDGAEQRVVYGVPSELDRPDLFEPTPWEVNTYDANDNAGRTHAGEAARYRHHWDTPSSVVVDALGRTVRTVERNRGTNPGDPVEEVVTRSTYDIRGNQLTMTDALNRTAFEYSYDLADRTLRLESIDAGVRRVVLDAAGGEVERRDGKKALVLREYDRLDRLSRVWARDDDGGEITLRQRVVYGDEGDRAEGRVKNRLGRIHRHFDEAGRVTIEAYDMKGNALDKERRVIKDERVADCFTRAGTNDWRADEDVLLETEGYRTSLAYDALNRLTSVLYPEDVDGQRARLDPHYNRAGALERLTLDGDVFVDRIAYNAIGQRAFIAYGNDVWTRYAYDPDTFRLRRLHTGGFSKPDDRTYRPRGAKLQDLAYHYDLDGNVLAILERVPGCGVRGNANVQGLPATEPSFSDPALTGLLASGDALFRRFEYDPLSRLTSATGRECADVPSPRPWTDDPRCGSSPPNHGAANPRNAPDLTAFYTERYTYDPAGNMLTMRHGGNGSAWTRHFGFGGSSPAAWDRAWRSHVGTNSPWIDPPGNQLTHVGDSDPATLQTHFFDPNGNLVRRNTDRHFRWGYGDRMRAFRVQAEGAEATVEAHYLYDAAGARVKKVVHRGGTAESTVYIDGLFERHRWDGRSGEGENDLIQVVDMGERRRIARVRRGPPHPEGSGPTIQFHLGDHLGGSATVVDDVGSFVNREEYFPYGETSFGSFARKRYRFTGKERDEESGLYYHGARYYAPWLGRWTAADPSGMIDGPNLYAYVRGNPIGRTDLDGSQSTEEVSGTENRSVDTPNGSTTNVESSEGSTPHPMSNEAFIRDLQSIVEDPVVRKEMRREIEKADSVEEMVEVLGRYEIYEKLKPLADKYNLDAFGVTVALSGDLFGVAGVEGQLGVQFVWLNRGPYQSSIAYKYGYMGAGGKLGGGAQVTGAGSVGVFGAAFLSAEGKAASPSPLSWTEWFNVVGPEGAAASGLGASVALDWFISSEGFLDPDAATDQAWVGFELSLGPAVGEGAAGSLDFGQQYYWLSSADYQRGERLRTERLRKAGSTFRPLTREDLQGR